MPSFTIRERIVRIVTACAAVAAIIAMVAAVEMHRTEAREYDGSVMTTAVPVHKGVKRAMTAEGRLYNRLKSAAGEAPPPEMLAQALEQRRAILNNAIVVRVIAPDQTVLLEHAVSLGGLVRLNVDAGGADVTIDTDQVRHILSALAQPYVAEPVHCIATRIQPRKPGKENEETGYEKIDAGDCIVRDGVGYADLADMIDEFTHVAMNDGGDLTIQLRVIRGEMHNATGRDLGELKLLSSGKTNFKGSPLSREKNIKKALYEHLNGVIIPAGETFSFNETLGGPVTQSRGWHMALGIFEGGNLRMTPGGGICQTSTTTFRAALYAGLPIAEQANHSLFVTYYEKYGVGQDATIFPGSRDLRFVNDTGSPIVIQATIDDKDAYVNFLGTPDGRTVTMEGPYFSGKNPDYVLVNNRPLRGNEIAWVRNVVKSGSGSVRELFVSRYKSGIGNAIRKHWSRDSVAAEPVRVNF